jgi:hypothetical protein
MSIKPGDGPLFKFLSTPPYTYVYSEYKRLKYGYHAEVPTAIGERSRDTE